MELIETDMKEYNQYFSKTPHIFNSVAFNELNSPKADSVHYFIFKDSKVRLGLCVGEKDGVLRSPFSAPFGGFSYSSELHKFKTIEGALSLMCEYAEKNGKSVRLVLPPDFYGRVIINETVSSLFRSAFAFKYADVNYQFFCEDFEGYETRLTKESRKNLKISFQSDYEFEKLDSAKPAAVSRAYSVIKANREFRGFPLRMTEAQVLETVQVVQADFFVLSVEGADAAAAQVFHVAPGIAQVIYWGDAPGFAEKKVMNLLAYKVFEHYARNTDVRIVDIGPSSENGIPNHGLCEFKENIGCKTALKYVFEFDVNNNYTGGGTSVK